MTFSLIRPHRAFRILLWAVLVTGCAASPVLAGGGPENVLLIVNPNSPDSLAIANHYVTLREIPPHNVVYLAWPEDEIMTPVDSFREKILLPILKSIKELRLANQIDCVVYSAGFPHRINIESDVARHLKAQKQERESEGKKDDSKWPEVLTKAGSLNGLTYLWRQVAAKDAGYASLSINRYFRHPNSSKQEHATMGFRGEYRFDESGNRVSSGGASYYLSTVLGFTKGRGNTREEILAYLTSAASADGTNPEGTIYYVRNDNIRSKTRHDIFPSAVAKLHELGVRAEIIEGTIPKDKPDVQGLMTGTAQFNWDKSGSTILPGAICDHLTSWGGGLHPKCPQTPLTEFLRYGAAGSSGTVYEPYAIAAKFPTAMLHVYYARGCTLAEAFYQSVAAPYQLLIVGDPLCRPWAKIPTVEVEGIREGETVKGMLEVTASGKLPDGSEAAGYELFIDGRRVDVADDGKLRFDTKKLPDGYHEIRVVAFDPSPICSQGRRILPFRTANHGRTFSVAVTPTENVRESDTITVEAKSPGAAAIGIFQNTRPVGRITGDAGKVQIDAKTLGTGPVRLDFIAISKKGPEGNVTAEPVFFEVQAGEERMKDEG